MRRYVNINCDADVRVEDVLEQLSDDDLLEAFKARQKEVPPEPPDLITEAYQALLDGDSAEALLLLERYIFPRWSSSEACAEAYKQARKKDA